MELPDLSRIVETHVPVIPGDERVYLNQLRRDILPHIRKLQTDGHIRWFSFLFHAKKHLEGGEPTDESPIIHLRLEPVSNLNPKAFIELLPKHFLSPEQVTLSEIGGVDGTILSGGDWAYAWKIHGEASEWVLFLLEGHREEPSKQQLLQFLHFITNPLGLLHECVHIPTKTSF